MSSPTPPFGVPGGGSLSPQQLALACAQRARLDVTAFASCAGHQIILPQLEQAILDCAVSAPTVPAFAECAAPQFGIRLSNEQRIIAGCAMRSQGNTSDFNSCAGDWVLGLFLIPPSTQNERVVLACARNSNGSVSDFASCAGSHILGEHPSREQQIALQCAAQAEGDYTVMASCSGANLFNVQLNAEQQIAVQCVVSTGDQPYAAAGCIGTRLIARELVKCSTDGVGGDRGCFGENNDLFGKNRWAARTMAQIAGGPNSVIRNPGQIWGGDNSFVTNPEQIWGGSNSFVRNPSQFWAGNNSIFNNPNQLAPAPTTLGTVGSKRVCIPWC
jgi:hypothetical protein